MRVALTSRLACVLVVGVLIAACDLAERNDRNPAADAWTALSARMNGQLSTLREREKTLAGRIASLTVPAGTEDVTLATTIAELQGGQVPLAQAIGKVEATVAQVTADVTAKLAEKDKRSAERTVAAGSKMFDDAATAAEPALALLEPKVDAAEQIMQRLGAGIEIELGSLRRLAATGGALDFSAIEFRPGSADFDFTHPGGRATLDRLVQFSASCPQLRFAIIGHTSKDGVPARNKEVSLQRAEAVQGYLFDQGVGAEKIARIEGLGSTKTLVDEPDPGTPAEAAMDAATLEGLRRRNRRITIEVVTSCAAPPPAMVAPPAAQPVVPPSPPTAVIVEQPPRPTPGARPTLPRPPAVQQPH